MDSMFIHSKFRFCRSTGCDGLWTVVFVGEWEEVCHFYDSTGKYRSKQESVDEYLSRQESKSVTSGYLVCITQTVQWLILGPFYDTQGVVTELISVQNLKVIKQRYLWNCLTTCNTKVIFKRNTKRTKES